MSTADQRADDGDRAAAIRRVHEALASGRIIQADHDLRVAQLEQAHSLQDIDLQVRDLAARPATVSVGAPPPAYGGPPPQVNYGPATLADTGAGSGRTIGFVIVAVVLIALVVPVAVAVIAISASRDSYDFATTESSAPTDETTYLPGQPAGEHGVNVHTADGLTELAEALREEAGTTFVYSAVLYPRYAVLDVPTGTGDRYQSWYWDGSTLVRQSFKSTSTNGQVDLSLVDAQQLVAGLSQVRERVEDPTSWYAVYTAPSGTTGQLAVYASNEFGESSYVLVELDGTVIYDSEQA